MTPEERAEKCLDDLVGEESTIGSLLPGPERDPNWWRPRGKKGESYKVILAAVRDAVAAERERCAGIARKVFLAGYNDQGSEIRYHVEKGTDPETL